MRVNASLQSHRKCLIRFVVKSPMVSRPTPERMSDSFSRWVGLSHGLFAEVRQQRRQGVVEIAAESSTESVAGVAAVGEPEPVCLTSPKRYQASMRPGETAMSAFDLRTRNQLMIDSGRPWYVALALLNSRKGSMNSGRSATTEMSSAP